MPWTIIHGRDRELYVRGAEAGAALYTRQPELALRFGGQMEARKWIDRHLFTAFDGLALLREPGRSEGRRGVASHYGARERP